MSALSDVVRYWRRGRGGGGVPETLYHRDDALLYIAYVIPVFEIKGAPCTRRAQFRRRVHVLVSCAPGVCMFFQ